MAKGARATVQSENWVTILVVLTNEKSLQSPAMWKKVSLQNKLPTN